MHCKKYSWVITISQYFLSIIIFMYFHKNHALPFLRNQKPSDHSLDISTESEEAEIAVLNPNPKTHHHDHHHPYSSKIKRSLCRNFTDQGFCPYGDKCQFAHGTSELRNNMPNNHSYKTRPCFTFMLNGHCLYGQRCNFIHEPLKRTEFADQDSKWRQIYSNFRQEKDMFRKKGGEGKSWLLGLIAGQGSQQ